MEDEGLTNEDTVDDVSATAATATVDTNLMVKVRGWRETLLTVNRYFYYALCCVPKFLHEWRKFCDSKT
eukprot:scaffold6360_cov219-Skeletonema_menzelii.AAC.3